MLLLMCYAGDSRFALPINEIVEVVGRPAFDAISTAPSWVPGAFVHRGVVTPVIDLGLLAGLGPARSMWSSRVIVLSRGDGITTRRVGVLFDRAHAEQVPEDRLKPTSAAGHVRVAPWGPTLLDEHGTYCLLDLPGLLSTARMDVLFPGSS